MDIKMPQLGESVTEGTLSKWLKKPGESVTKYEPICEVATDKVNAEVPSTIAGIMEELLIKEGQTVAVGQLICRIKAEKSSPENVTTISVPKEKKDNSETNKATIEMKTRYSPAVLRLANEHNLDLAQLIGTGLSGRITRKDVLTYIEKTKTAVPLPPSLPKATTESRVPNLGTDDQVILHTPIRRMIAERMVESKTRAPHAWTMMEVDVTGLVQLRTRLKADFLRQEGISLTFMPFFIAATVGALKEYPLLNSTWSEDHIVLKKDINISIAVATDDALYVPVIHNADEKSIKGLAMAVHQLANKTRAGELSLNDSQGGTFTVNNTGSFGSILSTPIINYPQAAILSFESIVKKPVVIDGMIGIRDRINICLSLDHRILDGIVAGQFLRRVKERLENYGLNSEI